MPKSGKPAITGIARPKGFRDDIAKFVLGKAAKATSKKREKAYVKMQKMGQAAPEKKFNKQYDRFEKLGKREMAYRSRVNARAKARARRKGR